MNPLQFIYRIKKQLFFVFAIVYCSWAVGQCPGGNAPVGGELITNGDFSAGNTGFTSGYHYVSGPGSLGPENTYAISTNPHNEHPGGASFFDHTTGTGNMMAVNGASTNHNIWCQTVTVSPHTYYSFSAWFANWSSDITNNLPDLEFKINDTLIGTPFNFPHPDGLWTEFIASWYSGNNTSISICIYDQQTAGYGNDFSMDDISFKGCSCNLPAQAGSVSANPDTVCMGSSSQISTAGSSGNIQWQSSEDGISFVDISGASVAIYNTPGLIQTTYYRVKASDNCGADTSTVKEIHISPKAAVPIVKVNPDTICTGSSSHLTVNAGTGTNQWQSSADGYSFTDIAGATNFVYETSPLIQTTYYRVMLTGKCGIDSSAITAVEVTASPVAGIISFFKDTICAGTLARISLKGNSGNIQWQFTNNVSGGFTDLPVDTNQLYTFILDKTTSYRIIASNGRCADTSAVFTENLTPSPIAVFIDSVAGQRVSFNSAGSTGADYYYWDFDDNTYSTEANPVHTYNKSDTTFHVCLTVNNHTNCNFTLCKNVTILPTDVNNITQADEWNVYPNPFNDNLFLKTRCMNCRMEEIEIYDLLGRMVFNQNPIIASSGLLVLDVSYLAKGMYYLRIRLDNTFYIRKLVKE